MGLLLAMGIVGRAAAAEILAEMGGFNALRAGADLGQIGADHALRRLFYLDELPVAETAEALDIPVGTVKSRLFHARQRLRGALQRKTP